MLKTKEKEGADGTYRVVSMREKRTMQMEMGDIERERERAKYYRKYTFRRVEKSESERECI